MQRLENNDRGQSGTIVALLMIPLMAMLALAIDVGAMHLEKQQLQTGADAAALAIAQDCANDDCSDPNDTAESMAEANFHSDGASGTVTALNKSDRTVTVQTNTVREHWFAPVVGIHSTPIQATATAEWEDPASVSAAGTFPLAFSWCALDALEESTEAQALYSSDNDCKDSDQTSIPGGFGWLSPDATCQSFDWVQGQYGWARSKPGKSMETCDDAPFDQFIGQKIFLPIFDDVDGQGSDGKLRIIGYASLTLSGYYFPSDRQGSLCKGNVLCVSGVFDRFVTLSESTDTPGAAVVTLTE